MTYDKITLETFLEKQGQLFDEPVAMDIEEADEFLDILCAPVVSGKKELKKYLDDMVDISGLSDAELLELAEVFPLPDGRFLIVEG